jgi:PQQ enzyme-like repeat protein
MGYQTIMQLIMLVTQSILLLQIQNYFTDGITGHKITAPHTIQDGLHNGTIVAMDLRTGKIKWQYRISAKSLSSSYKQYRFCRLHPIHRKDKDGFQSCKDD